VTCYLVRHGTAAAGSDDRARPLTPAGRAEIETTARILVARGAEVGEIRHSGLARAGETAAILARALAPSRGVHASTGLAPEDDPAIAAAELELADTPLLLVGHLPHLARLTATLVGGVAVERIRFAPGTAVALRRRPDGWALDGVMAPGEGSSA
jgi:phosphohistidine phosphatase